MSASETIGLDRFNTESLRLLVTTFRDAVRAHAGRLNRLNVYPVPDGDTGTNMSRTLDAVVEEMASAPADDLVATCDAISHGSLMGARGNSGVILSQVMRGIASTMKSVETHLGSDADGSDADGSDADGSDADGSDADGGPDAGAGGRRFADALQAASAGAYQAVLTPIEGTILTVVRESADAAAAAADAGQSLVDVVRAARTAGGVALENTPELLPVLKEAGVVDSGGAGFLLMLDAALHVVADEPLPEPEDDDGTGGAVAAAFDSVTAPSTPTSTAASSPSSISGASVVGGAGEIDVSEQRYEVMYFLDLLDDRIDEFKSGWGEIGDSIVVVGGDGLWNCHIHTNDVGASIEVALDLDGRPRRIRVTDLFEEVGEEHARREAHMAEELPVTADADGAVSSDRSGSAAPGAGLPPVTTAVVAVCSGDGLVELFAQLGVQGVVTGGQTMNPSTAELLDTVNTVNADQVVVLPNNKNIVPVAEQLDPLTGKRIVVVPTVSMPEALAALVVYDPEAGADINGSEMRDAADAVTTGEITQAVRTTTIDGTDVVEGDWMGLVRGDGIASVAKTQLEAAINLLDSIIGDDAEIMTLIVGADADAAITDQLTGWLGDHHGAVDVEVHHGGQPLYPYLFGVE
ncbi:MAG: DAK2 domain-containing protein [Actinomycetota bacterium]